MHIDWWTVGLQTVNVLVLVWLLQRFLYRPVAATIAARQTLTMQRLAEAAAARAAADEQGRKLQTERDRIAGAHESVLAEARAAAAVERQVMLAQAVEQAAAVTQDARAALQRERTEAATAMYDQAAKLAEQIARRLLERLPGTALVDAFTDDLCRTLADLPADRRSRIADDARSGMQVVAAVALSESARADCQRRLAMALGIPAESSTPVGFGVDPVLIAGIELRLRHFVLRNSWDADLKHILRDINDNDQGPPVHGN